MNATDYPRCRWTIEAQTFATGKFEPAHQCRFRALRNGFCRRHDPAAMRQTLVARIAATQQQFIDLDKKLNALGV